MGDTRGFLTWPRTLPVRRPVDDRLRDWQEVYEPQDLDETRRQAGRCMDCGIPFCTQGCPLGNHIPDWNDLVWRDRWRAAHVRLAATNNFPEFTGRLCPAPCEGACVLAIGHDDRPGGAPVTIEQVEKQIIERAFAEGWVSPPPSAAPTGNRVAIVGSGPAGLAAASQLAAVGHDVTVYEAAAKVGGLLRYGIPDFKLEKWVIDRRLSVMEAAGVKFRTGVDVGVDVGWDELRARSDAVLIAVGARRPRDLDVPGHDLGGVHFAMDFLTAQNQVVSGEPADGPRIDVAGKRVVILGGGDTGSDCLGTALRQGAAEVTQLELLPAPPDVRLPDNPWPQWPVIYRTSSSQEEGGARRFALMTTRLSGNGAGALARLHAVGIELIRSEGRARLGQIPGSEVEIAVDVLLLAMGYLGPETDRIAAQLGVAVDDRGNVATDRRYATTADGVFCAGDANRGQSLIVWAIAEGREAARAIDAHLRGDRSELPTRGRDQPFGGR